MIGFFAYMSYSTLIEGEFSARIMFLFTDPNRRLRQKWSDPDLIPYKTVLLFTSIQIVLTGIIFAVTISPGLYTSDYHICQI